MRSSGDRFGGVDVRTKRLMLAPVGLPFLFNGLVIVEFGHGPDERGRAMLAQDAREKCTTALDRRQDKSGLQP